MNNKKDNILIIDIGNSYTKMGVYQRDLEKSLKIILYPTQKKINQAFLMKKLKIFQNFNIRFVIMGSVVPYLKKIYSNLIYAFFNVVPYVINETTKFSFTIPQTARQEIGDDLLALCEYCVRKNKTSIGISFGTAIAAVYLQDRKLKGVSIGAGLGFGLNELVNKASLIEKNKINKFTCQKYGFNTISSLESGINNLRRGFVWSFYEAAKKENINAKLYCVITGGESFELNLVDFNYEINKESILIGFKQIYFLNN